MPRYRIILSSDLNLADDEFLALVNEISFIKDGNFEIIEAINLEGIVTPEDEVKDETK